ncbi:hypothetical protein GCM10017673_56050 [Streptosporangium violaceochromogenes]|nr:hypothetical protein GCM10017673_56050 [Streptosporangium violaceochromogenes]
MRIAPGRGDSGAAEHLLNDPDVHSLLDEKRRGDRPAGAVPPGAGHVEDAAGLLAGQGFDLDRAADGASTSVATFRVILPRRTAIVSARDRIRWIFRTVLVERFRSSIAA